MNITPIGIWGGYPNKNEATCAYLVEQDGFRCLLDCGSGVIAAVQNYTELKDIDAVIISHYHPDHVADVGVLQHAAMVGMQLKEWDVPLPIYAHDQDAAGFAALSYKGVTEGRAIQAQDTLELGPFQVTFCETDHPAYCLAMRFTDGKSTAVFTADTAWRDELVAFSQNADLLVSEANLYEKYLGIIQGHMSGSQAGQLATQAAAKQLLLTHLPQYGNLSEILVEAKKTYSGDVAFAEIGKVYEI